MNGGPALDALDPSRIVAVVTERLQLLDSLYEDERDKDLLKDLQEEKDILNQRRDEALIKMPKLSSPIDSKAVSQRIEAYESRIADLTARNAALERELSAAKIESVQKIQQLDERIADLLNGVELKAAKDEAARFKNEAVEKNKQVSLLESYCVFRGYSIQKMRFRRRRIREF